MFFVEKNLAGFSKLQSKCTQESFDYFFTRKPCFKTNCGQLKESCSLKAGNLWQNCQNCILILHGTTLTENNFFLMIGFSDSFSIAEHKKISLSSKSSRQACLNCILRVQRNRLRGKIFFPKKKDFWMFWDLSEKKVWSLMRKLLGRIL